MLFKYCLKQLINVTNVISEFLVSHYTRRGVGKSQTAIRIKVQVKFTKTNNLFSTQLRRNVDKGVPSLYRFLKTISVKLHCCCSSPGCKVVMERFPFEFLNCPCVARAAWSPALSSKNSNYPVSSSCRPSSANGVPQCLRKYELRYDLNGFIGFWKWASSMIVLSRHTVTNLEARTTLSAYLGIYDLCRWPTGSIRNDAADSFETLAVVCKTT